MNLNDFVERLSPEEKGQFVCLADTNRAYLSQLVHGHRRASPGLARAMVNASLLMFAADSERWLTLDGVRPDLWSQPEAAVGSRTNPKRAA